MSYASKIRSVSRLAEGVPTLARHCTDIVHLPPILHLYMVRRLAFPAPPPPWYGLVRGGGGPGVCGEGWGPLELQLEKRPGVTDKAGIVRKPYANPKSYNVAQ